eukprot:TRINITY_DN1575_c0_g1_i1.p1 TRINITY_DN1575_c0_g1~~TRINITY_DN1575_c0_g1_i1.p1  ORF type:complete len:98 (-),score=0.89 TRINITY_DN1575_c0_g1_i1:3-296(-)
MDQIGFSSRKAKIRGKKRKDKIVNSNIQKMTNHVDEVRKKRKDKIVNSNIQKMTNHVDEVRNYIEDNTILDQNVIVADVTIIKVYSNTLKTYASIGW